jgi:hypothetical protein
VQQARQAAGAIAAANQDDQDFEDASSDSFGTVDVDEGGDEDSEGFEEAQDSEHEDEQPADMADPEVAAAFMQQPGRLLSTEALLSIARRDGWAGNVVAAAEALEAEATLNKYAANLDQPVIGGSPLTCRQFLYTLMEINKLQSNSTDGAIDGMLRLMHKAFPGCLLPPSYHLVKQMIDIKQLDDCDHHVCKHCQLWAFSQLPRDQWAVVDPVPAGAALDPRFSCPLCRQPRFMYVRRPGDRTEIQPTMVGV